MTEANIPKNTIVLGKNQGRTYNMGNLTAVFKADEEETSEKYSVSEWWMDPGFDGVGAHLHEENEEVFYVLEGQVSFLTGDQWTTLGPGSFLRIPTNTLHDFKNESQERAGVLNFYIPGGFERNMPTIVKWFQENPST
jgi:mannose-6-phosphate isomerase-like protein (cupin superfamily)